MNNTPYKSPGQQWIARIERNSRDAAISMRNFWDNLDISAFTKNALPGQQKMQVPAELVQGIFKQIQLNKDFALRSDMETVYFINRKVMIVHGMNGSSVTAFEREKDFENAIKLSVLGHRELLSDNELRACIVYKMITNTLNP